MSKNRQHSVTTYAFRVGTPLVDVDTATVRDGYYNHKYFNDFIQLIIKSRKNKYKDGTNYFHLVTFNQSEDADIFSGKVHTTKYGTLSDIIDINTDAVVNQLAPIQGVKNEINFVINTKTGLLLIQNDPFRIISRAFLYDFLKANEPDASDLVKEFNKIHTPNILYKENTFTLQTIYDQGFYDQLAKIANVKSISVNTIVDKPSVNSALKKFTQTNAKEDEYLDEVTEMTYTFKNTIRNDGIKNVRRFVENAVDLEKIESVLAKGTGQGKNLKAEFKVKPQSYPVKTTKNEHGVLDQSKIISQMIKLAKEIE